MSNLHFLVLFNMMISNHANFTSTFVTLSSQSLTVNSVILARDYKDTKQQLFFL